MFTDWLLYLLAIYFIYLQFTMSNLYFHHCSSSLLNRGAYFLNDLFAQIVAGHHKSVFQMRYTWAWIYISLPLFMGQNTRLCMSYISEDIRYTWAWDMWNITLQHRSYCKVYRVSVSAWWKTKWLFKISMDISYTSYGSK